MGKGFRRHLRCLALERWFFEGFKLVLAGILVGGLEHELEHEFYDFPLYWEVHIPKHQAGLESGFDRLLMGCEWGISAVGSSWGIKHPFGTIESGCFSD